MKPTSLNHTPEVRVKQELAVKVEVKEEPVSPVLITCSPNHSQAEPTNPRKRLRPAQIPAEAKQARVTDVGAVTSKQRSITDFTKPANATSSSEFPEQTSSGISDEEQVVCLLLHESQFQACMGENSILLRCYKLRTLPQTLHVLTASGGDGRSYIGKIDICGRSKVTQFTDIKRVLNTSSDKKYWSMSVGESH